MAHVLFCIRNPNPGERERLEAAGCEGRDCLERCRVCVDGAFVVVEDADRNRTLVQDTLHDNIIRRLPEIEAEADRAAGAVRSEQAGGPGGAGGPEGAGGPGGGAASG
ncbi:MAG: hypothetical protein ACF8Q5_02970 [Phycisphaerales bacterium JB040]